LLWLIFYQFCLLMVVWF